MNIFDCINKHALRRPLWAMERSWDISAGYEGRECPTCPFHPRGLGRWRGKHVCGDWRCKRAHSVNVFHWTDPAQRQSLFHAAALWGAGRRAGVERRDKSGQTALSLASQHGHLDAVRPLLLNGAQTDTPDTGGRRPLDYAAQEHHGKVVKFLLKASRRQEIKDKHEDFTLSGSMETLASWQPENRPKTLHGAFPRGLRRLLCKQSVCDLFMTEHMH